MVFHRTLRLNLLGAAVLLVASQGSLLHSANRTSVPKAQKHEYRKEIDQVEENWRVAILKGNASALDDLLADDYTGITAKGAIQTKEQALSNLRSGTFQLSSINVSDRKVRVYGSTAVVTSLAELVGGKKDPEVTGRYRYTRVLVRSEAGKWKIVSFEASRILDAVDRK